jgi:ACR3 family arsenite transporter
VALNDTIVFVAYAPIVMLLLGISDIQVPFDTILLSVGLFVVVPFIGKPRSIIRVLTNLFQVVLLSDILLSPAKVLIG